MWESQNRVVWNKYFLNTIGKSQQYDTQRRGISTWMDSIIMMNRRKKAREFEWKKCCLFWDENNQKWNIYKLDFFASHFHVFCSFIAMRYTLEFSCCDDAKSIWDKKMKSMNNKSRNSFWDSLNRIIYECKTWTIQRLLIHIIIQSCRTLRFFVHFYCMTKCSRAFAFSLYYTMCLYGKGNRLLLYYHRISLSLLFLNRKKEMSQFYFTTDIKLFSRERKWKKEKRIILHKKCSNERKGILVEMCFSRHSLSSLIHSLILGNIIKYLWSKKK